MDQKAEIGEPLKECKLCKINGWWLCTNCEKVECEDCHAAVKRKDCYVRTDEKNRLVIPVEFICFNCTNKEN